MRADSCRFVVDTDTFARARAGGAPLKGVDADPSGERPRPLVPRKSVLPISRKSPGPKSRNGAAGWLASRYKALPAAPF